nr:uncharacterized protein LOC118877590 [Drosophila suzukii]
MDLKYHNKDVVLEIKGSEALFLNTSILDVLKSLKELSEPAGDANSGRVPKRRREEEEEVGPHLYTLAEGAGGQWLQLNNFPSSVTLRGAGGQWLQLNNSPWLTRDPRPLVAVAASEPHTKHRGPKGRRGLMVPTSQDMGTKRG